MKSKNSILGVIKENIALFDSFKHVYLFGSVIDPDIDHNDIDLLIIYTKYSDEIRNSLQVILDELEKSSGMLVDLTALSIEEEKDVAFLERIKSRYIKIK